MLLKNRSSIFMFIFLCFDYSFRFNILYSFTLLLIISFLLFIHFIYSRYKIKHECMHSGSRTAAEDGMEMTNGPSSMVNTELEGQAPAEEGGEEQEQEQPNMLGSPSNNNNIDPAILKAMDPHNGSNFCFSVFTSCQHFFTWCLHIHTQNLLHIFEN